MITINLDKSFEPIGVGIDYQSFIFSSGCESHIKLPVIKDKQAIITTRIKNADDIMLLLLTTDALRRSGVENIELYIPYLPYARQDRQMVSGEPLSIRVFSDLINSQNYSKVRVYDVHSEVSLALINNCQSIPNYSFVASVLKDKTAYFIVCPDAGAYKKIFKLCQFIDYRDEIILCNKSRDVTNGNITTMSCPIGDFQGFDLYIVDDICDGGGTFVMLAKMLRKRNCGRINLIASHGIFSKGIALDGIDHIYTTDSFKDFDSDTVLTQIKLCNTLS